MRGTRRVCRAASALHRPRRRTAIRSWKAEPADSVAATNVDIRVEPGVTGEILAGAVLERLKDGLAASVGGAVELSSLYTAPLPHDRRRCGGGQLPECESRPTAGRPGLLGVTMVAILAGLSNRTQ